MHRSLSLMFILLVVLLSSCQTPAAVNPTQTEPAPAPAATKTVKIFEFPTATFAPTATLSPKMLAWMQPVDKIPGSAPVTLHYRRNAETELIDAKGQRVLVDIVSADSVSAEMTAADLLLVTHSHSDHLNSDLVKSFPGQKMVNAAGSLTVEGVAVRGIPAQHSDGDEFSEEYASNYIYIIDIGGLRIAHFGDLGQSALLPEQLAAIGEVDVAIMQLSNSYSLMSIANKKGFNLLDQVQPRLIIPTHMDSDTARFAAEKWKAFYTAETSLSISPDSLPAETTILFMGGNSQFGQIAKVAEWGK